MPVLSESHKQSVGHCYDLVPLLPPAKIQDPQVNYILIIIITFCCVDAIADWRIPEWWIEERLFDNVVLSSDGGDHLGTL